MLFGREVHPFDFLRSRRAKGFEVDVSEDEARRGGEVDALVTISSLEGLRDVEVGLVCTEFYEGPSTSSEDTSSATYDAVAYETWAPVAAALGTHSVRLPIPPSAPFSYAGDCLAFKWEVVARGSRGRGLDMRATREISVLP